MARDADFLIVSATIARDVEQVWSLPTIRVLRALAADRPVLVLHPPEAADAAEFGSEIREFTLFLSRNSWTRNNDVTLA